MAGSTIKSFKVQVFVIDPSIKCCFSHFIGEKKKQDSNFFVEFQECVQMALEKKKILIL